MTKAALAVGGEHNPYFKELLEVHGAVPSEGDATLRMRADLRAKVEDDIEQERRAMHARLARLLASPRDETVLEAFHQLIEEWFDLPARFYMFAFADRDKASDYIHALDYLVKREAPIWDLLSKGLGDMGSAKLKIIVDGRVSHWTSIAMKHARDVKEINSSPGGLIRVFMEKTGITLTDGAGGFMEKFSKIGRDTLFAIRDEKRWVKEAHYIELAKFIGCRTEQLYPRGVGPRRVRRKRSI